MTTAKRFTNQEAMEISKTTLNQLAMGENGIPKLRAMLGASNFSFGQDGKTSFHFKLCKKANVVAITLTDSDLYDIEFFRYNKKTLEVKRVECYQGIYADQLQPIFTDYTGLDTHL